MSIELVQTAIGEGAIPTIDSDSYVTSVDGNRATSFNSNADAVRGVGSKSVGRIQALDGLRAVAIAWVLAFHVQTLGGRPWNGLLAAVAARGQFGVEIFFVLSGFLITMLLLREEDSHGRIDLRMFYIRRGFRILPPAMIYLLFIACLAAAGISTASHDILASALFFRNFVVGGSADTGHFWTLAIEEQFYLVWPVAMILLPKRMRLIAVVGLAFAMAIFRHEYYRLFPHATIHAIEFHYDGLLIGSLLALARQTDGLREVLNHPALASDAVILAATAAIAVLLSPLADRLGKHAEIAVPTLLSLLVAVVVNAVVDQQAGVISRLLSTKPMVVLGVLSYSLYLWQQPFCFGTSSLPLRLPWCLGCAVAAATASFLFIERPALRLRQRWFPSSASKRLAVA